MRRFAIYDIFKRNGVVFRDKEAVVDGNERFTFGDLLNRVNSLATGLRGGGVKKGDRIAVIAFNTPWFLSLYGAAAAVGAIIVPVNWRLSKEEVVHILKDCTPRIVFYDKANENVVRNIQSDETFNGSFIGLEQYKNDGKYIDDLLMEGEVFSSDACGDDPFTIIYTAAVDGQARGAVLSHDNIVHGNLQTIATFGLTTADTYLNMLPMFHITGINLAFSVMHKGGKNVILERFDAGAVLEFVEKEKVSVLGSFPPILSNLQEKMDEKDYDLSSLSHTLGIDSPEPIRAFEEKTNSTFWILYGQTETSGMVTFSPASEKRGSAGCQGLLTKIMIADDMDHEVPTGDSGEILVQGPLVFNGFWNRDGENLVTFRNGWHHTGDVGRLDRDGYLWFEGRKPEKELIKPGGENVYPVEVETVLLEHSDIMEASVIGVPDPKFGEGIKAICVLKEGVDLTAHEVSEFVAARIARYKKPRYVEFTSHLPREKDGSVDRDAVKNIFGKNDDSA